jgi:hypothetical protein
MKYFNVGEIGEGDSMCAVEAGVKNEGVQNYSVQYKGYNLFGVTTVERGGGSNDSTIFFLYIRQLL